MHVGWIVLICLFSGVFLLFFVIMHIGLGAGSISTRRATSGRTYTIDRHTVHTIPRLKFQYRPYFVKRKYHQELLSMMILVDKLLTRHDIPYWMTAGTLLGAVRHQGFIPWDDDVDLVYMEEDLPRIQALPWDRYKLVFDQDRVFEKGTRMHYPFVDLVPAHKERKKVTFRPEYLKMFPKEVFPERWVFPLRRLQFESSQFWAPHDPEKCVFHMYGTRCLKEVKARTWVDSLLPWVGNHRMAALFNVH